MEFCSLLCSFFPRKFISASLFKLEIEGGGAFQGWERNRSRKVCCSCLFCSEIEDVCQHQRSTSVSLAVPIAPGLNTKLQLQVKQVRRRVATVTNDTYSVLSTSKSGK